MANATRWARIGMLGTAATWAGTGAIAQTPAVGAPMRIAAGAISGADTAWVLTSACLVLMMTLPGLSLFYGGLVRKKNILATMSQVFGVAAVVAVGWFALGYSLAFGHGTSWYGSFEKAFGTHLASGVNAPVPVHGLMPTVPESVFALFQCGFAVITAALIVGAFAERIKFSAALLFCLAWSLLVYAPVAYWIWMPSGWLNMLGVRDFAGGLVVHVNAGAAALAVAMVVGPRRGFGRAPMIPSNLAYMLIGAGMLTIGWFGFNGGSSGGANAVAGLASVNTLIAMAAATLVYAFFDWIFREQAGLVGLATGAVAGLVAITPAAGFVGVGSAYLFGLAGGVASYLALAWLKPLINLDDALDVFAIHGAVGIVGSLMTPFFVVPEIAGFSGHPLAEAGGAIAVLGYSFSVSWVLMKLIDLVFGVRVKPQDENTGLDVSQHGEQVE